MVWVKLNAIAASVIGVIWIDAFGFAGQSATPTPGDVVVEIKTAPGSRSPLKFVPVSSPTPARFPSFNSQQLDRQLQRYLAYLEKFGSPDILIVGSSRALQGVDPAALQQGLAQHGYPGLRVYNFGINGATAQVVDWLLQTLLTPEQLPRLIVWADGSRAFNSGRVDQTFNKIIASKGYKSLSSNVPASTDAFVLGQICVDMLPVQIPTQQTAQVGLYANNSISVAQSGRSTNPPCNQSVKLIVRPGKPPIAAANLSPPSLEDLGFQSIDTRFSPSVYFQRYPKVPGNYDADYRNFSLRGRQAEAFERVVRFANRRQIPLVYANLPLTLIYLDSTRSLNEEQYRNRMGQLADSKRFIFKDLVTQPQLNQNQYFADPSHLNRHGAAAVSMQLSKELTPSMRNLLQRELRIEN